MVNQNSLRVDALDKGRKHSSLGIRASSRDQDVVGMPVDRQNGRPERLLEMLRDPPVVLFIEGTDSDRPTYRLITRLSAEDHAIGMDTAD